MSRHIQKLGTLTIANGGTNSGALLAGNVATQFGSNVDMVIFAPAALTGTVTMQIAPLESPSAGDWKTAYLGGADVTIPAGKAVVVPVVAFKNMRLVSSGAEGADRNFEVFAQVDVGC